MVAAEAVGLVGQAEGTLGRARCLNTAHPMEPDITRGRRLRHARPCGVALAIGWLLLGCTPQSPQPTEDAFPILTADARDDWNRYVDRRCAPEPVAVEPPECASEAIRSALDDCGDAPTCIAAVRAAARCQGRGGVMLQPSELWAQAMARVIEDDCDGVLEAMMTTCASGTPWWAEAPITDKGRTCIARSTHPDARWLLLVGRGSGRHEALLAQPEATAAWMKRWLDSVASTPSNFSGALSFWKAFDGLPRRYQLELLPAIRQTAATEFVDPWQRRAWRDEAIERLATLGDEASVGSLRRMLWERSDWTLQANAAAALGAMGTTASEAKADLSALAKSHWSEGVRQQAENAALRVSGKPAPELQRRHAPHGWDPRYPRISASILGERGSAWRWYDPLAVELNGQGVEFDRLPFEPPALPEALESFDLAAALPDVEGIRAWRAGLTAAVRARNGWVLGTDMGEFGGAAFFVADDGSARVLVAHNVNRTLEWGGARFLLMGLGHLGSDGLLAQIEDTDQGVVLRRVLELPEAPYDVALVGDRLVQATHAGVAIVSPSFELELRPYATRRPAPRRLPSTYEAAMRTHLDDHEAALQRCLQPLSGLTEGCDEHPAGLGVWFDIDWTGVIEQVVPFTASEDRHRRPASPEVAACIERVASPWTFPPFESGWTTLGVTFDADAD